ncbi:MAG: site-specific integrase [Solirubrobacteraceae bacterium]
MPFTGSKPTAPEQTFGEFAWHWFEASKLEWRPKTQLDYSWQLRCHLVPFFGQHTLSQITIAEVDRYRHSLLATGKLSASSINKTITRLAQILEVALEYGLIERNPARGRRRKLRAARPPAIWLDRAEQIEALLSAAAELDRRAAEHGGREHRGGPVYRRALLSTLVLAGLRMGELIELRWRDLDFAGERIAVQAAKTDAGIRHVEMLPALRAELEGRRARRADAGPEDFVFASARGSRAIHGNIRRRAFDPVVQLANRNLVQAGEVPLPQGLTPHKLRHTFASILIAIGVDPGSVMEQLGHADPGFTLRVYRHGMRRDEASRERLARLVGVGSRDR